MLWQRLLLDLTGRNEPTWDVFCCQVGWTGNNRPRSLSSMCEEVRCPVTVPFSSLGVLISLPIPITFQHSLLVVSGAISRDDSCGSRGGAKRSPSMQSCLKTKSEETVFQGFLFPEQGFIIRSCGLCLCVHLPFSVSWSFHTCIKGYCDKKGQPLHSEWPHF